MFVYTLSECERSAIREALNLSLQSGGLIYLDAEAVRDALHIVETAEPVNVEVIDEQPEA